jgi:hypothetical protein
LVGVIGTAVLLAAFPAVAAGQEDSDSYCPPATSSVAEVIRLQDGLGCELIPELALRTVGPEDGYLRDGDITCRWGQGGTRPLQVGGKTYIPGYCSDPELETQVTYLGRRLKDSVSQRVYVGSAYKPKRKWCPTNRTCLTKIKWTTYTSTRAVGVGRGRECAGGGLGCRTYRKLRVVLTKPESMCDRIQFSELRMFGRTFTAGEAPLCNVYYAP